MSMSLESARRAANSLSPLPASLAQLVAVTATPEFEFDEVVDIVAHDMVLAAVVLRAANSVWSAPVRQIDTVREAVARMGAVHTLAVAMHATVGSEMQGDLRCYGTSAAELWAHSWAASIAAGDIRRRAVVSLPVSTSTTALLHDIGKVVLGGLLDGFPGMDIAGTALERCAQEEALFGLDHAAVGALVAEHWKLPPAIVEGIAGHHRLVDDPLPSAIGLADHVAHLAAEGLDPWHIDAESGAALSACAVLGIPAVDLDVIVAFTRARLADVADGAGGPVGERRR